VFPDAQALEARFGTISPQGYVLQEYLAGPSYSIEVIGRPGDYSALQITSLEMDRDHDCKRVLAPSPIPSDLTGPFANTAVTLAEAIGLSGIMDVEAILHQGQLKVLEIDARFPSQTPIAVYHSTGINMVERLAMVFSAQDRIEPESIPARPGSEPTTAGPVRGSVTARSMRGSVLEHIWVRRGCLSVCGERVMPEAGPLHLEADFFGADEALTSHTHGTDDWVATLMVTGSDLGDALERRDQVIGEIRRRFGLGNYSDDYPLDRLGQVG